MKFQLCQGMRLQHNRHNAATKKKLKNERKGRCGEANTERLVR